MSSFKDRASLPQPRTIDVNTPTYKQVDAFLLAILSPLLAPLAGFVTAWVGVHFPGIHIAAKNTTDLMIAGVAGFIFLVITLCAKQVAEGRTKLADLDHFVTTEVGNLAGEAGISLTDVEQLVKDEVSKHGAAVVAAVEEKLPASVRSALEAFLKETGLQVGLVPAADTPAPVAETAPPSGVASSPPNSAATGVPSAPGTPGQVT